MPQCTVTQWILIKHNTGSFAFEPCKWEIPEGGTCRKAWRSSCPDKCENCARNLWNTFMSVVVGIFKVGLSLDKETLKAPGSISNNRSVVIFGLGLMQTFHLLLSINHIHIEWFCTFQWHLRKCCAHYVASWKGLGGVEAEMLDGCVVHLTLQQTRVCLCYWPETNSTFFL